MQRNLNETLIRKQLAKYLSGAMTLQAFQKWFVPAAWSVDKRSPAAARQLVGTIKVRLAEYSNGHWGKEDLERQLRLLLGSYTVEKYTGASAPSKTFTARIGSSSPSAQRQEWVQTGTRSSLVSV
jgi:hypothetical protein